MNEKLLILNSNKSGFFTYNAHGDVTALTNQTGSITKRYNYDAFGVETAKNQTDSNPFRYAGEYFDSSSGTYYLRNRHYNPSTGRFLTKDTYWNTNNMIYGDNPNPNNPVPDINAIRQSSNLYAYAMNNPIRWIDPSGFKIELSSSATDMQKEEYKRTIEYLNTSKDGKALVAKLESSETIFTIMFIDDDNMRYEYSTNTLYFDIQSGLVMKDGTSIQSAALGLAHEMGHGAQHLDGEADVFLKDPSKKP